MIAGRYFDGTSSAGANASLALDADGVARLHGLPIRVQAPLDDLEFSERIGNIPRRVTFPGGGVFETLENDAIDEARKAAGLEGNGTWLHRLESRWRVVFASLAAIVVLSVVFVQWGIPALATQVARVIPAEADRAIGMGTLKVLDRSFFDESQLPAGRREELLARFEAMTGRLDDGHEYRLLFRHSKAIGANAFALPSGIIVVTDDLVDIAEDDEEIVAVLAHEVGHVRGRHALRQLLQASGISALAVALLGDVSSLSGLLSAAPALLHAKHSRDFEREADAFSKSWLRENGIAESRFDAILCRMARQEGGSDAESTDFFASHPATGERANCVAEDLDVVN